MKTINLIITFFLLLLIKEWIESKQTNNPMSLPGYTLIAGKIYEYVNDTEAKTKNNYE